MSRPVAAAIAAVLLVVAAGGDPADGRVRMPPACSPSAPQPSHAGKPATGPLVPGRPRSMQLCRYAARTSHPYSAGGPLVAERVLQSRATVARTATLMNRLQPLRGSYSCPFDDGSMITVTFRYRDGSARRVLVGLSACEDVTRAGIHRSALKTPGPALLELLFSLTPVDR